MMRHGLREAMGRIPREAQKQRRLNQLQLHQQKSAAAFDAIDAGVERCRIERGNRAGGRFPDFTGCLGRFLGAAEIVLRAEVSSPRNLDYRMTE